MKISSRNRPFCLSETKFMNVSKVFFALQCLLLLSGTARAESENAIALSGQYRGELNYVRSGGLRKGSAFLGQLDLRSQFDLEKLAGWHGGSIAFNLMANHGADPSRNVGDMQVTSSIETRYNSIKVYEAWFQQSFFAGRASALLGLHDLNTEFYASNVTALFFHSTFAIGRELSQTGVNGPSIFPVTAPALRLRGDLGAFTVQAAAFGARAGNPNAPNGTHVSISPKNRLLLITEVAFHTGREKDGLAGKYGIGAWRYTRTFDHLTDASSQEPAKANSQGAYFLSEQALNRHASVFLRYGIASARVNRTRASLATGAVFTGLVPGRGEDRFGLGFVRAENGTPYRDAKAAEGEATSRAESAWEITYRLEFGHGLSLQPAFQRVLNPNSDPGIPDANVASIRFEWSF